jgi:hypothetical protein
MSITWNLDKPSWNFAEVTAYPVVLPQKGKQVNVYVFLSPYRAEELKDILRKAVSGYRREKRDVEIVREDKGVYASLCDSHFVRLGNATGTPEQQRAWLDKYPQLKPSIVEFTFGGLCMEPVKTQDEDGDDALDISAELLGEVKVYQELFDESTDKIVRVNMAHQYAPPTEAQFREYRSARRSKFIRKSTLWTITEQHGTLEKLYDAVTQSISGAMVNGKSCDAVNKAEWIGHVPLWHKLWVVDQIFGELVEKND